MRTPTPAALILLSAGLSPKRIAEELGVTPQAVSFQLAGRAAETSSDLIAAVAALTDEKTAGQVARAITRSRKERANA